MSRGSAFSFDGSGQEREQSVPASQQRAWAHTAQVLALLGATLPGLRASAQGTPQGPQDAPATVSTLREREAQEPAHRQAAAEVTFVRNATEAVDKWSPSTNLIITGDISNRNNALRITQAEANELATFLAQTKYRNWTVYITDSVARASYRDPEGNRHSGFDAVSFELGLGIQKQPGYETLIDPRTGLANAAIIFISFDPAHRAIDVSMGDAYDRFGLSETNWKGNLDSIALPDLKAGRTAQAIKNTVTELDARLSRAIERGVVERSSAA